MEIVGADTFVHIDLNEAVELELVYTGRVYAKDSTG